MQSGAQSIEGLLRVQSIVTTLISMSKETLLLAYLLVTHITLGIDFLSMQIISLYHIKRERELILQHSIRWQ